MLTHAKYYLQAENDRNTHDGQLFIDILKRAFGADEVVMVGHHFVFEPKQSMEALDLTKLNEIPSADTVMFDHDIMREVFGERYYVRIMQDLAATPVEGRDKLLRDYYNQHYPLPLTVAPQPATPVTSADDWRDPPLSRALAVNRQQLLADATAEAFAGK